MYRIGHGYCYYHRNCSVTLMEHIPFDKRSGKIWFNGELVKWQDTKVHVISHGMHYASLVFEGIRIYNKKIFKLEEHTKRLFHSANIMDMNVPYSEDEMNIATKELVENQGIVNGYIRPFIWRGSEMMGVSAQKTKINVAIAIWDWPAYFDPELKKKGIKLNISRWQRPPQNSSPWNSKAAGLYMICTLSKHEAEKKGFTDSLMVDHEGNIAEATSANVFFKDKNNELNTPIPDSFLDGITRKTVIDIAKSKNIKVNERKISPDELQNFTGRFITGTAAEITPIASIQDYKFEVCDLILDLSSSYEKLVGKNYLKFYLLIPLNLSDRRLKSSALTRIKVDNTIKHVATAKIVGLNCSLSPVHICIGIVVFSKPARNNTTTTSSNDVTNANNPPEITPGKINGSVIFIKVFTGLLPRLEAALVTL